MSAPPECNRREVLARAAAAGLTLGAGLGLALAAPATAAGTQTQNATTGPGGAVPEVVLVARMLRAARLAVYCYQQVLAEPLAGTLDTQRLMVQQAHDQVHVALLAARLAGLGGSPVSAPADPSEANRELARRHVGQRVGQLRGRKDALRLLVSAEQVVVGACYDALIKLQDPTTISVTLQIMASDAQHVTMLRVLLNPVQGAQWAPYGLVEGDA